MDNDGLITTKELTDALQFLKANLDEQDLNALLERYMGRSHLSACRLVTHMCVISEICVYVRACVPICGQKPPGNIWRLMILPTSSSPYARRLLTLQSPSGWWTETL